ncbi:MAG: hypothetical protein ABSD41_05540 [Candidatus Bathyarchaeia archaeon]
MSGVNSSTFLTPFWWVSVPFGVVGLALLIWVVKLLGSQRADFRHAIGTEMQILLKQLAGEQINFDAIFPIWSSKTDHSKEEILGKVDYAQLKMFYERIEERERYLELTHGYNYPVLEKLNRECVREFSKLFDNVGWFRELNVQAESILLKAKK